MSELSIEQIQKILPHRYPFLLVDKVTECDDNLHIVAIKNVTINEPFFQGHFPGIPIMPGVLQLEAMAQTGGILLTQRADMENIGIPFFMTMDKVKFRKIIKPGDQMRIEVGILKVRSRQARFTGRILVDGAVASQAELMCMFGTTGTV